MTKTSKQYYIATVIMMMTIMIVVMVTISVIGKLK
jgi:hypothetical protein